MNERIKKVRKVLELTQQEFADRIGVKRNTIANYEINRNEPSNSVISLICREFNVNEEWLRTGKGQMFIQQTRDEEIASAVENFLKSESSDFRKRLISVLCKLDTAEWQMLEERLKEIVGMREETVSDNLSSVITDKEIKDEIPDVMSKLAKLEQQNKKLLARLEVLEKEEDEWERKQMEQSISPTRFHT